MATRLRRHRADGLALLLLLALPLLWFLPVLFPAWSGATLLPFDNLAAFEPWRSLHPELVPHNALLSDLVLENAVWKLHIRRTLAAGQLPLWNPQIFAGVPFLAAGQASTLYPLSLLFYLLPLTAAYGWFTALQLAIAGINAYLLGRVLRLQPLAALFTGVVFMFSGFMMASVVFTMVIAAASWLPLLLATIELMVRKQEEKGVANFHPVPYMALGAGVIGLTALAGHPEFFYYTLLVAGLYSLVRLTLAWGTLGHGAEEGTSSRHRAPQAADRRAVALCLARLAGWLLAMALLGGAAGAVQLLPLYELVRLNFRADSADYAQVVGWAWPSRQLLTFALPDLFGNPSHHRWFDLWQGQWRPSPAGQPIFWGIKNYVEGANYLGILTWLLAAVALLRPLAAPYPTPTHWRTTWLCAALALLALLFAFGTPLYALLFYGLPGWNQLHSPFRWVFPFTVSMAILGGLGLQALLELATTQSGDWRFRLGWNRRLRLRILVRLLAATSGLSGLTALAAVTLSRWWPAPFVALGQRLLASSDLAAAAFNDGQMFWGYQAVNLVKFGAAAVSAGALLGWFTLGRAPSPVGPTAPRRFSLANHRHLALAGLLAVGLVTADLYAVLGRFNPAADPLLSPLDARSMPPVVAFLNQREGLGSDPAELGQPLPPGAAPWRFTTLNQPGEKTFNANVGMYYGWHDIRGYDSIIPRHYVALMAQIAPQAGELLYNRIAPLYVTRVNPDGSVPLGPHPLLDLLNVKYLLTQERLDSAHWVEIYRDAAIAVYENPSVLPRAFIAQEAVVLPAAEQPLLAADLRRTVYIEEPPAAANSLIPSSPTLATAQISRYTANDLFVDVNLSDRGWLVLSDSYFPGWKAYLRPFGSGEADEEELPLYRANGALRAVYLPDDGQWTVRFVYSPMSLKLGLYATFLAAMALLLLLLWWGWGRYYRPDGEADEARTVAKNSLVPMGLSLANKAVDFAFAMLYVRLLGPEGTGKYAFVVALYGFFEIISRYGLGTLLTRDVAADKEQSSRYLSNVLALRTLLWLVSLPLMALVTAGYRLGGRISVEEIQAIALFALVMLFANWADALSSVFNAFEKMEYPAGLASAIALLKVTLGALVLLLGGGFVGLAAASLATNLLQTAWLYRMLRRTLFRPQWQWDGGLQRWMLSVSGPLMVNHLLATIFWRIDIWILRPLAGAASVGLYSVALKYLDGLNVIPSAFTFAIFPLMSRYARRPGEGLLRAYLLSVRLLLMVSLPIAMTVTFIAAPLVYLVGGAEYLAVPERVQLFGRTLTYQGGSPLALQLIIWSIPIGFVNSVTQFVLIAVNQQHYLTRAFLLGVTFNVVGNLLLIPHFGYVGAAVVTILSEFSLLLPFAYRVHRHVGAVPWRSLAWRPLLAVAVMGTILSLLTGMGFNVWPSLLLGWLCYAVALAVAGAFQGEEMALVARALPFGRWARRARPLPG